MRPARRSGVPLLVAIAWLASTQPPALALREPDDRWIEIDTPQFVLLGDVSESHGRTLSLQLERLRHVLAEVAPVMRTNASRPLYVYAFGEDAAFRTYAKKQGVHAGVGGLSFTGSDGDFVMINAGGEVYTFGILYHEYLHHVMLDSFPGLPLWLNEGMAEFFSTFWTNGYQAEIGVPIGEHLALLNSVPLLPLERLFEVTPQSPEYSEASAKKRFHAESWLLTHYLLQGRPELRGPLARYLQAGREGPPDVGAFEATFGVSVPELEAQLRAYLRRAVLPSSTIDFPLPLPAAAFTLEEISEQQVHFRLGRLLANGVPEGYDLAGRHLARALDLDPADTACLVSMAALRARQGRKGDATAYERMAAASSLLSRGETAEALATLRGALAAATEPAARRALEKRIRQIEAGPGE